MSGRWLLLAAFLTGLASLAYVRGRFLVVELSYEASNQKALQDSLEQDRRSLTLELATLKDPRRIERIAKVKLGLTTPRRKVRKIIVKKEEL